MASNRRYKSGLWCTAGALALCWASTVVAANNASYAAAMESITADELYRYVEVLADDVYEGRAAGSRGGRAAAQWLLKHVEPLKLTPAGRDGSYAQTFGNDCRNILALLPGDDPELTEEVVVLGAHYDHVGYGSNNNSFGPTGKIHNGADDNASGTAMLLETMEAFARSGLKTRRTILFAFWDGEERGMVGSRYWLANPTLPLQRVKLNVTLDMVGRLRDQKLSVLGTRSGYGLRRLFADTADDALSLNFSWDIKANSDHWPFIEREIPIALLHTGLHSDYHRPSDDVEKINRQGMQEVCRYLLVTIVRVANEDRLPTFRQAVRRESESTRSTRERPLPQASLNNWPADEPRPRLGVSWRDDEAEPGTVFVIRVVDGTPAAAAGLQVGDRIYELDGRPFPDAAVFQSRMNEILESNRPEFDMLTERQGHRSSVSIKLRSADAAK